MNYLFLSLILTLVNYVLISEGMQRHARKVGLNEAQFNTLSEKAKINIFATLSVSYLTQQIYFLVKYSENLTSPTFTEGEIVFCFFVISICSLVSLLISKCHKGTTYSIVAIAIIISMIVFGESTGLMSLIK